MLHVCISVASTKNKSERLAVKVQVCARVLYSPNFTDAKFCEKKLLQNGEFTLTCTDVGKSCFSREFLSH